MSEPYAYRAPEIGRVVVLEHPHYKKHAEDAVEDLQAARLGVDILKLQTQPTIDDAIELLINKTQPGDIIRIEGGDGSRSKMIAAALRLAESGDQKERNLAAHIAFSAGTAGNGRDGARAERGRRHLNASPSWTLRHSVQARAWGMDVQAVQRMSGSNERQPVRFTSSLYACAGATALAT